MKALQALETRRSVRQVTESCYVQQHVRGNKLTASLLRLYEEQNMFIEEGVNLQPPNDIYIYMYMYIYVVPHR